MKRTFQIILIFCCSIFFTNAQKKDVLTPTFELPNRGLCAHRGAMKTHPENTIPAFRAAVEAGAHMVELDVWLTKDNQIVVLHDSKVDRTTNGEGNVSDLTFREIRKLDAGKWKDVEFVGAKIPTFDEVLSEMPYNVWINVHVKGEGELPVKVAKTIAEAGRLHQAFMACNIEAARQAKAVAPGIMICNMERQSTPQEYVNLTIDSKADFIQITTIDYPGITDDLKLLKDNGIRINYFGTDSPELIKKLLEIGVDFPLVNDIFEGLKVSEELNIEPVKPIFSME